MSIGVVVLACTTPQQSTDNGVCFHFTPEIKCIVFFVIAEFERISILLCLRQSHEVNLSKKVPNVHLLKHGQWFVSGVQWGWCMYLCRYACLVRVVLLQTVQIRVARCNKHCPKPCANVLLFGNSDSHFPWWQTKQNLFRQALRNKCGPKQLIFSRSTTTTSKLQPRGRQTNHSRDLNYDTFTCKMFCYDPSLLHRCRTIRLQTIQ